MKKSDVEVRAEYDLSNGIRGRHAARFTAQERDELLRRAAVQDVQTWIGFALLQVQELEAALFKYLVLTRNASPEQAETEAAALLDANEPQGLGRLMATGSRESSIEELDARFTSLVAERRWLVHRSGYESQSALAEPERRELLLRRLERISDEAEGLRGEIERLVAQHLVRSGLSKQQADKKTQEAAELWLAA